MSSTGSTVPSIRLMGLNGPATAEIQAAALVHDLGRTAISSEIWERPGSLGLADRVWVRLHSYWTERILVWCPVVTPLSRAAGGASRTARRHWIPPQRECAGTRARGTCARGGYRGRGLVSASRRLAVWSHRP